MSDFFKVRDGYNFDETNVLFKREQTPEEIKAIADKHEADRKAELKRKAAAEARTLALQSAHLEALMRRSRLIVFAANELHKELRETGLTREDCVRIASSAELALSLDDVSIAVGGMEG